MRILGRVMAVAAGLVATTASVVAQPPATEGFEKVSQLPAVEQLPAAPLLMTAYAFIWVAVLAYVFLLWRRLAGVDRDLAELRRAVEGRE